MTMGEFSRESAVKFAEKVDEIRRNMSDVSPNQMVEALGLEKHSLSSTQAIITMDIIRDIKEGGDGMKGLEALFKLGITLGRAYEWEGGW
jgi:hypothetical protein